MFLSRQSVQILSQLIRLCFSLFIISKDFCFFEKLYSKKDVLISCYQDKLLKVLTPLREQLYIFQLVLVGNMDQKRFELLWLSFLAYVFRNN